MSRFRHRDHRSDLPGLLQSGHELRQRLADVNHGWGLGTADSWKIDQINGEITWTWPDHTASARVQVLGSLTSGAAGRWTWAWADDSIEESMCRDVDKVRAWGEAKQQVALTSPSFAADEAMAGDVSAIALGLTTPGGFYRARLSDRASFYTSFAAVTIGEVAAGE